MKLKLTKKEKVAKDTMSFFFEPEKPISWLPGQYFYFTLPNPKYPDPRGNTHYFTIATSPTEGKVILCTTRMREKSLYKKSLAELKVGDEIEGEGPEGTFILDEKEKGDHVLIAGGIGITPFRSILKYHTDKKLPTKLHLIYANSTPEEITYLSELKKLVKNNKNITIDFTVTKPDKKWKGLVGRVDAEMIKRLTSEYENPKYWLCGPPAMVDAMESALGKLKITADKVKAEKFSGYAS